MIYDGIVDAKDRTDNQQNIVMKTSIPILTVISGLTLSLQGVLGAGSGSAEPGTSGNVGGGNFNGQWQ
jgi:hypothetical protein